MPRLTEPSGTAASPEEYLRLEEKSLERHEFVDGQMFMMAGGSVQHSQIALRLASKLLEATDGTDCEVVNSDVKLQIGKIYYYPDVMVSCEEDRLERTFFKSPCFIAEVLCASTEPIDRGEKLLSYRTIPSLQSYVLLAQDTARAEIYKRLPDGSWRYDVLEGDAILEIGCANLSLKVSSLYRGVLMDAPT
jgi:Uma2 family endonuclease